MSLNKRIKQRFCCRIVKHIGVIESRKPLVFFHRYRVYGRAQRRDWLANLIGGCGKPHRLWLCNFSNTGVILFDLQQRTQLYPFAIEVAARYWNGTEHRALMTVDGAVVSVIQGNDTHQNSWKYVAKGYGASSVRLLAKIPMVALLGLKIDRKSLVALQR